MSSEADKLIDDLVQLVAPLEADALSAVIELVKQVMTRPEGAALAAKRQAEALAAEVAIRS